MVGKLGPTELAAVSLANSFVFIAMSLGIAGLFASEGVVISNAEVVSKSYPEFWNDLARLSP